MNYEHLNDLDFDELVKVANTQAERYNKQVTRAKKAGIWGEIKRLNPAATRFKLTKGNKLKELKALPEHVASEILIRTIHMRENIAAGGYTKKSLKRMREVENLIESAGITPAATGSAPTPAARMVRPVELAAEMQATTREVYYEILKYGVQTGYYSSFSAVDKPDIKAGDTAAMREELLKIQEHASQYGFQDTRAETDVWEAIRVLEESGDEGIDEYVNLLL